MSAVIYRKHNCTAKHRTFNAFAKCALKRRRAELSIWREGPWACIQQCRTFPHTVIGAELFNTEAEAVEAMSWECGGACRGRSGHRVVFLDKGDK